MCIEWFIAVHSSPWLCKTQYGINRFSLQILLFLFIWQVLIFVSAFDLDSRSLFYCHHNGRSVAESILHSPFGSSWSCSSFTPLDGRKLSVLASCNDYRSPCMTGFHNLLMMILNIKSGIRMITSLHLGLWIQFPKNSPPASSTPPLQRRFGTISKSVFFRRTVLVCLSYANVSSHVLKEISLLVLITPRSKGFGRN